MPQLNFLSSLSSPKQILRFLSFISDCGKDDFLFCGSSVNRYALYFAALARHSTLVTMEGGESCTGNGKKAITRRLSCLLCTVIS